MPKTLNRLVAALLLVAASLGWAEEKVLSFEEQGKLLTAIVERAAKSAAKGKNPAAAFDIDDTLLLTSPRTKTILLELCRAQGKKYPGLLEKVTALVPEKMPHGIVANLLLLGVDNAETRKEIIKFWRPKFIGNDYLIHDWPIAGAISYLEKLRKNGTTIYYVTARPSKTMQAGTEKSLKHFGFPLDAKAKLVMNVDSQPSPPFKGRVMDDLEKQHELIALFENEPDNLNAMYKAAPTAQPVFIQTVQTAGSGPLGKDIPRVKDYRMAEDAKAK